MHLKNKTLLTMLRMFPDQFEQLFRDAVAYYKHFPQMRKVSDFQMQFKSIKGLNKRYRMN